MKRMGLVILVTLALLIPAAAQQSGGSDQALPQGFKTTPVLKSTTTASHGKIAYPRAGQAEVVSVTGELEPGGRTARHQHPVPTMVYVLQGTITVQAEGAQPREYSAGQAFMEDVNHWHQAFNKGSAPVKVLVVFMGEEGKPTTVTAK
jgi:quercetin dioxygenase-like cupin family protein